MQNGRLDYGVLNGYQNVFHIKFKEEKLIQYLFRANGLFFIILFILKQC